MSAGTIKLTSGSTAVGGTSTTFTTDLKPGDVITTTIGGVFYTLFVDTVTSATALTLSDAFTGPTTTGAAYVAVPQMTLNRITAALAAQTAEAVRRVLQENANWQAFYSGSGDITVTLPNGTPTGVQIPGPSWAKLSGIANTAWIDRGQLAADANLNTMNPATTEGEWSKSTGTGLTTANGFPAGALQGTLKVNNGGRFQGQHVYTDYTGNQWVRSLSAAWNGTDGPWTDWANTATKSLRSTLVVGSSTDISTYTTADLYGTLRVSSGTAANGWPYDGFAGTVEVVQGYGQGSQQIALSATGNQFSRFWNGGGTALSNWSAWVEIGRQPRPLAFVGNVDTLFDLGEHPTTSATTGLPTVPGTSAVPGGLINVRLRSSGVYMQEWTVFGSNSDIANQRFTRTYWSSAWQPWREVLDDKSMYWVLGYGQSAMARSTLDWQNDSFSIGESFYVNGANMTNVPAGMDSTTLNVDIHVRCGDGTGTRIVDVVYSTATASGYRKYELRLSGTAGARTIIVRQVWTQHDVVPMANGGTGATTAAAARTNLDVFATGEIGPEFIAGLDLSVSASSVTVSPGAAYIPSGGIARVTAAITQSFSGTANSWLHVYLYMNGTTPAVEVVATAPVAYSYPAHQKTGAATRRYLGSIRVGASGGLAAEVVNGVCRYMTAYNGNQVLAGGKATAESSIVINTFLPPVTSKTALIESYNASTDSAVFLYSKPGGLGATIARANMDIYVELSSASYPYVYYYTNVSTAGSGYYANITGYSYAR